MVNLTQGVDHNYTIVIHNVTTTLSQMVEYKTVAKMYILFEKCGRFDVQVRAINGAGESEPSDTVRLSLPLLPDIQPVSDSLQHKLWKLSGHGQVMLQIQFEVTMSCKVNFLTVLLRTIHNCIYTASILLFRSNHSVLYLATV